MFQDIHGVDSASFKPDCLQEPRESRDRFLKKRRKPIESARGVSDETSNEDISEQKADGCRNHLDIHA